jgi:hypothetical protein
MSWRDPTCAVLARSNVIANVDDVGEMAVSESQQVGMPADGARAAAQTWDLGMSPAASQLFYVCFQSENNAAVCRFGNKRNGR